MPASRLYHLTWPAAGLDKAVAYQAQPPFTTPSAQNVRTFETYERRARGGSRPGLLAALTEHADMGPGLYSTGLVTLLNSRIYGNATFPGWVTAGSLIKLIDRPAPWAGATYQNEWYTVVTRVSSTELIVETTTNTRPTYEYLLVESETALIRLLATCPWVSSGTRKEGLFAVEGREAFYRVTGTAFLKCTTSNPFPAGTTQLFAAHKQQKLYIANPAGSAYSDPNMDQVQVWDPSSPATVAPLVITAGTPPSACPLICTYRDRIVLAGPDHMWYMSHVCEPGNWNYGCAIDDPARPIWGSTGDAGAVGEPITAMVPYSDEHLIFGCPNSLHVLRGDPGYGGRMDTISYDIGILWGTAWCRTPEDAVVFLSRHGLYVLPPGGAAKPQPLSINRLPDELRNLDPVTDRISMGFNLMENTIHISRTTLADDGDHWVFDWRAKAFWGDSLPSFSQPTYYCQYAADMTAAKELLLGTRGGRVLKYDDDTTTDDDSLGDTDTLSSYILIGPFRLGGDDYHSGVISELLATLDASSGDVTWELLVGDTMEEAVGASAFATGTWGAGRSYSEHPRAGGGAGIVKITATGRWALEQIIARVERMGLQRIT